MKNGFFLILIVFLFVSCKQNHDPIVAEAYHYKLYRSEVIDNIPSNLNAEDSIIFFNKYVEHWLMERVLLKSAEKTLSLQEMNFDNEIKKYRRS